MEKFKKIILIILGITILVSVWYFTVKPLLEKKTPEFEAFKKLYNNNSQIALNTDNYSILKKSGEISKENVNVSFEFSGTDTIIEIDANKETTIKLDINSKIDNGKFKMVLVSPHNEITSICKGSHKKVKEFNLMQGKSRIKVVGLAAKGSLNLKVIPSKKEEIKEITPLTNGLETNENKTQNKEKNK